MEHKTMFMQILAETPKWVFVIFFVLLYYGYMQSKTRMVGKGRVVILPVIMTLLSIGGVFSSFGGQPASLLAWVAGFAAAVGVNRIIRAPAGVRFDPATKRFHLPGSWTPFGLMMVIYFAKYAIGATTALRPDIVATSTFAVVLSCIFGGLSGTFFARFLRIWFTASRDGAIEQDTETRPLTVPLQ
jgi:hypothetical protein